MAPCCWKFSAIFLLACCFGIPLLAEVIPLTSSQQTSVSGGALACDPLCQQFNYPGETDPGAYFSSSTSGSATDSFHYRWATSSAWAGGTGATISDHQIILDLGGGSSFSGNWSLQGADANVSDQYSLAFDLTSSSLVHVTGGFVASTSGGGPGAVFGSLDGEIDLAGPGFHFDQVAPPMGQGFGLDQPFEASFTLPPGVYTLNGTAVASADQVYALNATSNIDVSLEADFTDIPEPGWISWLAGLFIASAIGLARSRGK